MEMDDNGKVIQTNTQKVEEMPLWSVTGHAGDSPKPLNDAARIADLRLEVEALNGVLKMVRELATTFQARMITAESEIDYYKEKTRLVTLEARKDKLIQVK